MLLSRVPLTMLSVLGDSQTVFAIFDAPVRSVCQSKRYHSVNTRTSNNVLEIHEVRLRDLPMCPNLYNKFILSVIVKFIELPSLFEIERSE